MDVVLTRLLAAHPSASPALLGALAERQLSALDPATVRGLLGRADLPGASCRHIADAIARATCQAPVVAEHDDAPEEVLLRVAPTWNAQAWLTVLQCLPRPSAELVALAAGLPPFDAGTATVLCTIARQTHLPAQVRAGALARAAQIRPLGIEDLGALSATAGVVAAPPRQYQRGSPSNATLLSAAASPYPPHERAEAIAARLASVQSRASDAFLTARCVLLRSGSRSTDVARAAMATCGGASVLDAIIATPSVSAAVRHASVRERVRRHAIVDAERIGAHLDDLALERDGALARSLLLRLGRVRPVVACSDLAGDEVDAALNALRERAARKAFDRDELPAVYAGLAALPAASARSREAARAALHAMRASGARDRALAAVTLATTARWRDLPVTLTGDLTDATPGLRLALDAGLSELLTGIDSSESARALLMLLDTPPGTLDELFDLAATIAA